MVLCMVRTAVTVRKRSEELSEKVILTSCGDKVEKPLSCGGQCNVCSSKTSSGNLTHENPARWSPSELESSAQLLVIVIKAYSRFTDAAQR